MTNKFIGHYMRQSVYHPLWDLVIGSIQDPALWYVTDFARSPVRFSMYDGIEISTIFSMLRLIEEMNDENRN
jgi:hypothetical protein